MADREKPQFFGTDGIRGTAGEFPLVPDFVQKLGFAIGNISKSGDAQKKVLIGRDTRQSGHLLLSALSTGLVYAGIDVEDCGIIPTPAISYLVKKYDYMAGVMISASHNPHHQNGIKVFSKNGQKFSEDNELKVERSALNDALPSSGVRSFGSIAISEEMKSHYIDDQIHGVPGIDLSGVTIVLDCSNGAAYEIAPNIISRLGANLILISCEPDGQNINRQCGSEHVRKNPRSIAQEITRNKADIGIAFDGDADRVILADRNGRVIDGDDIISIIASYLFKAQMLCGGTVVTSNMRNTGLAQYLAVQGINLVETRVGDKYITDELFKLGMIGSRGIGLGGEQSGHIILMDDMHITGDGIRTALMLLRIWHEQGRPEFTDFFENYPKYPQIIANAIVSSKPPLESIPGAIDAYDIVKTALPGLERIDIRYSGTESMLRVMIESQPIHDEKTLGTYAYNLCRLVQNASGTMDGAIEILNISRGGLISL